MSLSNKRNWIHENRMDLVFEFLGYKSLGKEFKEFCEMRWREKNE